MSSRISETMPLTYARSMRQCNFNYVALGRENPKNGTPSFMFVSKYFAPEICMFFNKQHFRGFVLL